MIGKRQKRVKETVCALASGGIDSSVMVAELARRFKVQPLYIRCGYKWENAEIHGLKNYLSALPASLKKDIAPLAVLHLPSDDFWKENEHWSVSGRRTPGYRSHDETVYLPGRNLLFLSKAATFCSLQKISVVALGSLSGNPFPDASPSFFKAMEKAARLALNHPIRFITPLRSFTKGEVVSRGRGLPLHLCFSCLSPRGLKPCGRCNKCAERDKVKDSFTAPS